MDKTYDVGYRRPPRHTQVKKGECGNPSGRPKGSRNVRTVITQWLLKPRTMMVNGERRTVSNVEVIFTKLMAELGAGNPRAMTCLMDLVKYIAATEPPADGRDGPDQEGSVEPDDEDIIEKALARSLRKMGANND